jgi:hypothetical protein
MHNSLANSNEDQTQQWTEYFFNEHNIVNTIQCLLIETSRTINDLNELCVAMIQNNVVFCLTHRGLLPFASKHMYIFPYEKMNKQQLQALRSESKNTHETFAAVYDHDKYAVHGLLLPKIDHVLVLFAANCILAHGLNTSTLKKHGFVMTKMQPSQLTYHINATLLQMFRAIDNIIRLLNSQNIS